MRNVHHTRERIEASLRQAAPSLRAADQARVDAVCMRVATAGPQRCFAGDRPHALNKHLVRAAACLVLALGLAVLVRTPSPSTRAVEMPKLSLAFDRAYDLVATAPTLDASLRNEAADLTDDFADLTIAINNHAFSLLL